MVAILFVFIMSAAGTMAQGCDKAVNESNYGVKATYSTVPNNEKYASGTKVNFTCEHGFFVKRSDDAICEDGEWKPHEDAKLRRCPYMCKLSQLKQKGCKTMWVDGADKKQDYFLHGTTAYAFCYTIVSDFPIFQPPNIMCIHGKWIRSRGKGDCFGRS